MTETQHLWVELGELIAIVILWIKVFFYGG